jgi:hypothetical protein
LLSKFLGTCLKLKPPSWEMFQHLLGVSSWNVVITVVSIQWKDVVPGWVMYSANLCFHSHITTWLQENSQNWTIPKMYVKIHPKELNAMIMAYMELIKPYTQCVEFLCIKTHILNCMKNAWLSIDEAFRQYAYVCKIHPRDWKLWPCLDGTYWKAYSNIH